MSSLDYSDNENILNPLPPRISNNIREKLDPEQVSLCNIFLGQKTILKNVEKSYEQDLEKPRPLCQLQIDWFPSVLEFELENDPIIGRLRVWNACKRSIYIQCCGIWDEAGRLGASWCCYPRTRFLLAPGLIGDIFIKAAPRNFSPTPNANLAIEVDAAYKRDHLVGHFLVPINVRFLKYIPPTLGEDG